jgi:hypothetical protein
MVFIPSFIKTGSGIQKFVRGKSQPRRLHGDVVNLLLFSK